MGSDTWIFGYGSLVWRPAFEFIERHPARLLGWKRRFWQHSTDHRGVPGAPGRVVTLLPDDGEWVGGMAYRVAGEVVDDIRARLDHREKGGYARHRLPVSLRDDSDRDALVYVATPENPEYAGPAPLEAIAEQVRGARGPSGPNIEYVLRLAEAMEALGFADPHVAELARLLRP